MSLNVLNRGRARRRPDRVSDDSEPDSPNDTTMSACETLCTST